MESRFFSSSSRGGEIRSQSLPPSGLRNTPFRVPATSTSGLFGDWRGRELPPRLVLRSSSSGQRPHSGKLLRRHRDQVSTPPRIRASPLADPPRVIAQRHRICCRPVRATPSARRHFETQTRVHRQFRAVHPRSPKWPAKLRCRLLVQFVAIPARELLQWRSKPTPQSQLQARLFAKTSCREFYSRKKLRAPQLSPKSPLVVFGFRHWSLFLVTSGVLVRRAFRHNHKVHAPVRLFLSLFLGRFANSRRYARRVNALFAEVLLRTISAGLRQLGRLWFLGICVSNDHELRRRIVLQTQRNVIANALAGIVKPRRAYRVVAAIAGLGRLRRRRRLLHVHVCGRFRRAATAVAHRALHGVASRLQSGRIKRRLCAVAAHLTCARAVRVSQRIAIGIARRRSNSGPLTRHNRAAIGG